MAPASPDLGRGAVLLRKDGKTGRCPVYDQASLGTYPLSRRLPLGSSVPSDGCAGRSHSILRRVYYLKTENRAGLSKITVYVKKEIRADEMQQLWDKLRRKVNDVQGKLPSGAGTSIVNDDFGDVLGVFYGLTGESYTYRELEDQAKLIKDDLLKVKDVAKVEIYGIQTPVIDIRINPTILSNRGITTADIKRAFDGQNKMVDAGSIRNGETRIRIESTGNFYSLDDIRNLTIVSHSGEHFRLGDIARIEESYQTPPQNFMRINNKQAVGIAISTVPTGNVVDMAKAVKKRIQSFSETMPKGFESPPYTTKDMSPPWPTKDLS